LKYEKLDKEYQQIQIGDKVFVVYLKKNPYRIDSIALTGYNDPPIILELVEEFIDKDKLFEAVLQQKIEKVYGDVGFGQPIFNSIISDFFSFG
jgi:hypothetical protein